ncbi:hypothetical protein GCAAIG_07585 [Candidatus Electronema halotolerans]
MQADVTLAATLPDIVSTMTIEGGGHFISGNNDENVGSVLYITSDGDLTLNETTIKEGKTTGDGGGIYNDGTAYLTNSIVSGNTASSSSSDGGGIQNKGVIYLTNSTVSGNTASSSSFSSDGGGIYNYGTVTLTNSTVSNNTASSSSFSNGSGIYNAGTVTLTNSTISGNTASSTSSASSGGGIYNYGTVTLTNSTINGNTASSTSSDSSGGGIYNAGTVTLTNSTISGNTASSTSYSYGGGIYNYGNGTVTVTNSTISGNTASSTSSASFGGGIYNYGTDTGTVTLQSSIISGNTAYIVNEVYNKDTFNAVVNAASFNIFGHSGETDTEAFSGFTPGSSDVTATSDGDTPTTLDAILNTTLADNDGPTQTHALVAGSPAIDLDKDCSTELTEDQRGYTRPVGAGCDAGSFESADITVIFTVTPNAGTGGSVTPDTAQTVADGSTASFTVTPDAGYSADEVVSGTCPEGSWDGSIYTTGQIDADCTVEFSFIADKKKINMVPIYKLLLLK